MIYIFISSVDEELCYDTIRYDIRCMRCYFSVRSKADTSELNLPHGTNYQKVENRKKTKK